MPDFTEKAKQLLAAQKNDWPTARGNYSDLEKVQVRMFYFDGFQVKVQFNPARIVSSAAKVDRQSIASRKCFLCAENRPAEQQEIAFGNYLILVNPFPIFPEHFTIPLTSHVPQEISGKFGDMLDLAKALPGFTVFYNGPKCGASAPDHFHFQAGSEGFMPIENEMENLKIAKSRKLSITTPEVWAVDDGLRRFLVLEHPEKEKIAGFWEFLYGSLEAVAGKGEENVMLNILVRFVENRWQALVFPRFRHRPWQYFEEGEKNILLSPASVDMGGALITPLEKDFLKIEKEDIIDIFRQLVWPEENFNLLIEKLLNYA